MNVFSSYKEKKKYFLDCFTHLRRLRILTPCCLRPAAPTFRKFQAVSERENFDQILVSINISTFFFDLCRVNRIHLGLVCSVSGGSLCRQLREWFEDTEDFNQPMLPAREPLSGAYRRIHELPLVIFRIKLKNGRQTL